MASPTEISHQKSTTNHDEEESFSYASHISMGTALPMAMKTAIDLKIFDIMFKAGPDAKLSAPAIATQLPTTNPDAPAMLDRILRLLATHSILGCSFSVDTQERLYHLTSVSKFFFTTEDGGLGPLLTILQSEVYMQSWSYLKDAIIEGGIPFNNAHGMSVFEYSQTDPRIDKVFNTAMYDHTTIITKNLLKWYKGFDDLNQLVDVGGGLGVVLHIITSKYPQIKGINFDLPSVIQHALPYPGVEHVEGDMFQSVPQGDAIFMKWILHDWSDEHCLKLLKNCYKAIPKDGKVIVLDSILTKMVEKSAIARCDSLMDVWMMTLTTGGKERTRQEFLGLATAAGFSGIRFISRVCNLWIMEFFK